VEEEYFDRLQGLLRQKDQQDDDRAARGPAHLQVARGTYQGVNLWIERSRRCIFYDILFENCF